MDRSGAAMAFCAACLLAGCGSDDDGGNAAAGGTAGLSPYPQAGFSGGGAPATGGSGGAAAVSGSTAARPFRSRVPGQA